MQSVVEAEAGRDHAPAGTMVLTTFVAAIFLSAFLLFAVQPMFAKMILPLLGGSPAVWSVAMVFFQAVLLGGYAYAHWLTRAVGVRRATLIHLALMTAAVFVLPIDVAEGWNDPPSSGQAIWLIGLLAVSVGLPFFAVAGNGPLLQAWFARTGHAQSHDPYFLYAASNVGSFAALLLYPLVFEPGFTLAGQSALWFGGFLALVVAIGGAAVLTLRTAVAGETVADRPAAALPPRTVLAWIGLAFVPSALLVAVTSHISTDIAAIPFLWVVPLALYLLTFVIAFQRRPLIPHRWALVVVPVLIAPLALTGIRSGALENIGVGIILHLSLFFFAALACHGELARRRPEAAHLTGFYLAMAFGGVLGGIFSGLVAPAIFSSVLEYPLLMIAALVCLPAFWRVPRREAVRELALVAAATAALAIPALLNLVPARLYEGLAFAVLVGGIAAIVLTRRSPALQVGVVVAVMIISDAYRPIHGDTDSHRSFFGVHRVVETLDGQFRLLMNGTTLHGAERIRNADGTPVKGDPEPSTYYYNGGALADAIAAVREVRGRPLRVAAVGLGTGSIACQRRPGGMWRFYEIDQTVIDIASDKENFGFLESCAPDAPIIVGDARRTLAEEPAGAFDAIVMDAFSSDSIPVHLLTQEAVASYVERLAPGGVIIFHISNRHMDLAPVVANSAAANGLVTRTFTSQPDAVGLRELNGATAAAVVARSDADLGRLAAGPGAWRVAAPDPTLRTWTDDYSNVLGLILRGGPG